MARFPTRENDVAVLAEGLIERFTENTEYFPSPPVSAEELQTSYQAYKQARDAALTTAGAAKAAYDLKDEALDGLTDNMKANLKYAEIVANDDEAKLALLKWGGRRSPRHSSRPTGRAIWRWRARARAGSFSTGSRRC